MSNGSQKGAAMTQSLNTLKEASERLGVSTFTLRRLIKAGSLKGVYVARRLLISESEILRICSEGCSSGKQSET
jgi:excisionase family DNA binding protein